MTMLRLVFMGTPDFAVPALDAVLEAGHEVVAVYTQPPRPAKRGQKEQPSVVQILAQKNGLHVRVPSSLAGRGERDDFKALDADVALVAAYGLLLPKGILDVPRFGCINIHASLLPRWRGAAPVQRAIMAGDTETGISIMRIDEGLDTGPVFASEAIAISQSDDFGSLHDRLAELGAGAAISVLAELEAGKAVAHPQNSNGATYATKIDKSETHIDWSYEAAAIDRQVRALSPRPGAWCEVAGERLKILGGTPCDLSGQPGEVLDDELTVACGEGAFRITRAQRPGKAAMDAATLQRGFPVAAGHKVQ
jgi:methionyl-tRNA formyltransferase